MVQSVGELSVRLRCVCLCVCVRKTGRIEMRLDRRARVGGGVIEDEDTSWQEASVVPACLKWLHSSV